MALWIGAPLATAVVAPRESGTRIELNVPIVTSVTPGWQSGDGSVRLPNLAVPGEPQDATSNGWRMTTNWVKGYEIRLRATTSPALRGRNAVDGKGAQDSFADFSTSAECPCPWSGKGYERGIFGYSVSVASTGPAAFDAEKWGSPRARRWRGFTRQSYRAYATPGGAGTYTMSLHFRTMIPEGAAQREGSYRASIIASAHPIF